MITITHIVLDDAELRCNIKVAKEAHASKNFKWRELADPTTLTLKFSPKLLNLVQYTREKNNWVINTSNGLSWYRTDEFNAQIGGVPNSQHTKGLAVDVKCWVDYVGGQQVNPLHVAYAFKIAMEELKLKGCIGTYMPGYTTNTNGYNHIDIRGEDLLYVCYKKGQLENITNLTQIKI